jgi:hypothetical protein
MVANAFEEEKGIVRRPGETTLLPEVVRCCHVTWWRWVWRPPKTGPMVPAPPGLGDHWTGVPEAELSAGSVGGP